MPIPRRFDRRPPERDTTRINERIRVPEVRLIDEKGEQVGVVKVQDALKYARERDLDLVEIAAEARPPVCRVLDYSKYKYEQEQRRKAARKHQQQVTVREMKLRPKIATHDYETKKGHILRFLKHGQKVKVTIMFRGREQTHPERGERLLLRLADDVAELGTIEQRPQQDGRNMTMMLHHRELGQLVGQAVQDLLPALRMRDLASAEHDRDLDLVLVAEEALDVPLLGGVVVRRDLRAELDLAYDDVLLALARLLLLLSLLVLVLRVVEHPHDWRAGLSSDLDQVEIAVLCVAKGLVGAHDTDLSSLLVDKPHLGDSDPVVDPGLIPLGRTPVETSRYRH